MCVDTRRSTCWVSMMDGRCEGSVHSDITKAECCASVGQAWGSPCEKCPYAEVIAAVGHATALPFGPSIAPGQSCQVWDISPHPMSPLDMFTLSDSMMSHVNMSCHVWDISPHQMYPLDMFRLSDSMMSHVNRFAEW